MLCLHWTTAMLFIVLIEVSGPNKAWHVLMSLHEFPCSSITSFHLLLIFAPQLSRQLTDLTLRVG
jgi:hypothetical protein